MAIPRIRVAVVDDDVSVRKALRRLLNIASFDIGVYSSGTEFLESLESFRPQCVILDVHMPVLNGIEVQRRLYAIKSRIPVIVITGHDSSKARAESLALGASAYFIKPIAAEALIGAIRSSGAGPPDGNGEPAIGVSMPPSPLRNTATLLLPGFTANT
jgi:FixJ family two-component response regulator